MVPADLTVQEMALPLSFSLRYPPTPPGEHKPLSIQPFFPLPVKVHRFVFPTLSTPMYRPLFVDRTTSYLLYLFTPPFSAFGPLSGALILRFAGRKKNIFSVHRAKITKFRTRLFRYVTHASAYFPFFPPEITRVFSFSV